MSFNVERTYYKLELKDHGGVHKYHKKPIDKQDIHSGDNILVKVKVVSKSAHEYVLIEDPIPGRM